MYNDSSEKEDSASDSERMDKHLCGIEGWLILPAIGLALSPIGLFVNLAQLVEVFSNITNTRYANLLILDAIADIAIVSFAMYTAIHFFQKRSTAPAMIIKLLRVAYIVPFVLFIISLAMSAEIVAFLELKYSILAMIAAAIWISYFEKSKRVKATFFSNEQEYLEFLQAVVRKKEFYDGVNLSNEGKQEDAIKEFQEALGKTWRKKNKGIIHYNIAVCHMKQGNIAEALHSLKTSLSLNPYLAFSAEKEKDFSSVIDADMLSMISSAKKRTKIIKFLISLVISALITMFFIAIFH
jgi:tetratricopeptide (TPR) repeat protein